MWSPHLVACVSILIISLFFKPVLSEPVQYCRHGYQQGEVDFCVGITMHHNQTTASHDLYLSMTITRPSNALGWTAVAAGSVMDGALMFIVYGDPRAGTAPILSIRTVAEHHQPHLVERSDMGTADLRVLQATWLSSSSSSLALETSSSFSSSTAKISLVCYACTHFPGTPISAATSSQPWIWAWNAKQEFDVFDFDARLDMHAHHAGKGGWGRFYVDMSRSTSNEQLRPSLPPLRPGVTALGASDGPIGAGGVWEGFRARPVAHLHGLLMAAAYVLLFPLGVVMMRGGSTNSFRWHWVVQVMGCLFVFLGAVLGWWMSGTGQAFASKHQALGTVLSVLLAVQCVAGWRHHVDFVRIGQRTWISHLHVWLGRLGMVAGWMNVLLGLALAGCGKTVLALVTLVIVLDASGVGIWVWLSARRATARSSRPEVDRAPSTAQWNGNVERYFALGTESEDGEDGEDDEALKSRDSREKEKGVAEERGA